jgi:hypothetical protein
VKEIAEGSRTGAADVLEERRGREGPDHPGGDLGPAEVGVGLALQVQCGEGGAGARAHVLVQHAHRQHRQGRENQIVEREVPEEGNDGPGVRAYGNEGRAGCNILVLTAKYLE